MKKLISLLFIAALFTQFSCEPEPTLEATTDVELVFKGKYGAETFLINNEYVFNDYPIRFDQFNFFIGNVVLVKEIVGNPEETELVEIDFVDLSFKPTDSDAAKVGFVVTAPNIPVGEYSGIKINFGVPADFNKTSWDEYGSGHPLRRAAHYWAAWESFIFSKTEARMDIDNDGGYVHKLAYHTGSDEAYRTKFFAKSIDLEEGVNTHISFEINVAEMFDGINVLQDNGTHNTSDMSLVNEVMNNLQNRAVTIE